MDSVLFKSIVMERMEVHAIFVPFLYSCLISYETSPSKAIPFMNKMHEA